MNITDAKYKSIYLYLEKCITNNEKVYYQTIIDILKYKNEPKLSIDASLKDEKLIIKLKVNKQEEIFVFDKPNNQEQCFYTVRPVDMKGNAKFRGEKTDDN